MRRFDTSHVRFVATPPRTNFASSGPTFPPTPSSKKGRPRTPPSHLHPVRMYCKPRLIMLSMQRRGQARSGSFFSHLRVCPITGGYPLRRPPLCARPSPVGAQANAAIQGRGRGGALAPELQLLVVGGGRRRRRRRRCRCRPRLRRPRRRRGEGGGLGGGLVAALVLLAVVGRSGLGRGSGRHCCRQRGVPGLEAGRHLLGEAASVRREGGEEGTAVGDLRGGSRSRRMWGNACREKKISRGCGCAGHKVEGVREIKKSNRVASRPCTAPCVFELPGHPPPARLLLVLPPPSRPVFCLPSLSEPTTHRTPELLVKQVQDGAQRFVCVVLPVAGEPAVALH